ncbi:MULTISPECIES: DNA-binding protein [Streptomyces]|uniref:DNA-binding protein n=1 Tax=Streptomyces TaxID=1883 RepID=UPI0034108B8C
MLISLGHLSPVHNPDGEAGVTRASLLKEVEWRETTTFPRKVRRIFKGFVHWL